jgi:hypothetical protein
MKANIRTSSNRFMARRRFQEVRSTGKAVNPAMAREAGMLKREEAEKMNCSDLQKRQIQK